MGTGPEIFISYSRKDSERVLKVARQLEGRGYRVWIDVDSIPGGQPWATEIQNGVQNAIITLVFWSEAASQSLYIRSEYEQALQKQMEFPLEKRRILPILLEPLTQNPLPAGLSGNNALQMYNCSKSEIDELIRQIDPAGDLKYRKRIAFDKSVSLGKRADVTQIFSVKDMVRVPFMRSVHCEASIVSHSDTSLADILSADHPTIQVLTQFTLTYDPDGVVKQVYDAVQALNVASETAMHKQAPFFLLHIMGPHNDTSFVMRDTPNGFWRGQWLDAVNTTHEAITGLVGQWTGLIQLFTPSMVSIGIATGMRFYKYWNLQLFHFARDKQYRLVLDTDDLGV